MVTSEEIKNELQLLLKEADQLFNSLKSKENSTVYSPTDYIFFINAYDLWYSKALNIVKNLLPDRVNDFILLYRNDKRKEIRPSTYTISDALKGVSIKGSCSPLSALPNILQQRQILQACLDKFDSKIYDLQTVLQADIFDSEIDSARYLLKNGFLRAAGAICGVVLEKHLAKICENHNIKITKKDPSLATYNDALKDIVYDTIEWRRMQRLADLRNLCDHNKDREPTKEEVEELISGADRVIKSIG